MKKYWIILIVFLTFAILSAGCCGATQTTVDGTSSSTSTSTSTVSDLQLIESSVQPGDFGTKYIVGTIKNNGKRTYSYVQVTINLYDDDGAQVGSTLDNINNLEAGGTWKFKAMVFEEDATNYKIKEITGF